MDDIDRIAHAMPHLFFAACPRSDAEMCLVVDEDEFEPDDDVPAVAHLAGFEESLLVSDVQQVIANLYAQDPDAPRDVVLRAIEYYFLRDAFIDLSVN